MVLCGPYGVLRVSLAVAVLVTIKPGIAEGMGSTPTCMTRTGEHDDLVMAVWVAALGSRPRLSSKT